MDIPTLVNIVLFLLIYDLYINININILTILDILKIIIVFMAIYCNYINIKSIENIKNMHNEIKKQVIQFNVRKIIDMI